MLGTVLCLFACSADARPVEGATAELTSSERRQRASVIIDVARSAGLTNAVLLGGIADSETNMSHCHSEATWACQGPAHADCGGGPVIAGSGDGPCSIRQGGLGMFQFDAGTHDQTLQREGDRVLSLRGNIEAAVDFTVDMVIRSTYVSGVSTRQQALDWMNGVRVGNSQWDPWIRTVTHYYNGCTPSGCSIFNQRYDRYASRTSNVLNEMGETFWYSSSTSPPPDGCGSTCDDRPVCGNGRIETGEGCDDGNEVGGDGCDGGCNVERGWQCSGSPSRCSMDDGSGGGGSHDAWCGDGRIESGEQCDDDNTRSGDGCDAGCRVESGWRCSGEPSRCTGGESDDTAYQACGDGRIDPGEDCDDGNIRDGDGCDGDCWLEPGWDCRGAPSECTEYPSRDGEFDGTESYSECGNGTVEYGEECDNDRDRRSGDGCDYACRIETGWRCTGDPSRCEMLTGDASCGDGWIEQGEACDDGNAQDGDGCTASCRVESGYRCAGAGPDSCLRAGGSASGPPMACRLGHGGSAGAGTPSLAGGMLLAWLGWRRRGRRRGRASAPR